MRALSRSGSNGIPASREEGRSATEYRSAVSRCYSRTSRERCARSTRSRPADRHSRVRDETVDAYRSIDANASLAMGGTDVTEETRRRLTMRSARADSRDQAIDETSCVRLRTPDA